jgi:hypothetical protein
MNKCYSIQSLKCCVLKNIWRVRELTLAACPPQKLPIWRLCSLYITETYFPIYECCFAKFVDSPYCSESELWKGALTVSFSKYLPWQAMHFLERSTHFSKTCCRLFAESFRRIVEQAVLTSELPFHGWKSSEISWGEIWTVWRMFWRGSADLGERIHCHFPIVQRWPSSKVALPS